MIPGLASPSAPTIDPNTTSTQGHRVESLANSRILRSPQPRPVARKRTLLQIQRSTHRASIRKSMNRFETRAVSDLPVVTVLAVPQDVPRNTLACSAVDHPPHFSCSVNCNVPPSIDVTARNLFSTTSGQSRRRLEMSQSTIVSHLYAPCAPTIPGVLFSALKRACSATYTLRVHSEASAIRRCSSGPAIPRAGSSVFTKASHSAQSRSDIDWASSSCSRASSTPDFTHPPQPG